jgi:hypothetical protein
MKSSFLLLASVVFIAAAQETAQSPKPAPPEMNANEKAFQESMTNVSMLGFFTVGDSGEPHDDKYTVEKVTKLEADTWAFDARIQYNKKDYKATVKVPVKWAGDTPVLTLSNYLIAGQGVFSARILIHNNMYAGTWGNQSKGGKMFGKIVRNEAPAPAPAATPTPQQP